MLYYILWKRGGPMLAIAAFLVSACIRFALHNPQTVYSYGNTGYSHASPRVERPTSSQPRAAAPAAPVAEPDLRGMAATLTAASDCRLPKPDAREKIVMVGVGAGEGVSTVALGDPAATTTVTTLVVDADSPPLYVVLTAPQPMLWRFGTGAQRVGHAVVLSDSSDSRGAPAGGIIGLDPRRVATVRANTCLGHYLTKTPATVPRTHPLYAALGRQIDTGIAVPTATTLFLPGGKAIRQNVPAHLSDAAQPVPAGYNGTAWLAALRHYPAGLVAIDPAAIVSASDARAYRILPAEFAAAQRNGH